MKVLHVISPAPIGGAERVVLAGTAALAARGHDVTLLALRERRAPAPADALLSAAGGSVRREALDVEGRADGDALRALGQLAVRYDVMHAHGYKALTFATLSCRRPDRRLFATFHGVTAHTPSVRRWEALERRLFGAVCRVFAPSRGSAEYLVAGGLPSARVRVVANPVSLPPPTDTSPEPRRLLFVGRLSPEKGLDVLLRALPDGELQLDVVGDGPERATLLALRDALGLAGRVRFHGALRDVSPALARAGALVLPSHREGLPIAALEARVYGLPVLASAVGGLPELIRDGVDGLLAPPADVGAWRAVLARYTREEAALRCGARASTADTVARYAPARWAALTAETYGDTT